VSLER